MLANVNKEFSFHVVDPAVIPDEDKQVRPVRWLIILVGIFTGLVVGVFGAFSYDSYLEWRARRV